MTCAVWSYDNRMRWSRVSSCCASALFFFFIVAVVEKFLVLGVMIYEPFCHYFCSYSIKLRLWPGEMQCLAMTTKNGMFGGLQTITLPLMTCCQTCRVNAAFSAFGSSYHFPFDSLGPENSTVYKHTSLLAFQWQNSIASAPAPAVG